VCTNKTQTANKNKIKVHEGRDVRRRHKPSRANVCAWDSEFLSPVQWHSRLGPSSCEKMRHTAACGARLLGVGLRLLRHDGEIEGVFIEDDAVLILNFYCRLYCLSLGGIVQRIVLKAQELKE
jgi:hypothetical protein